MSVDPDEPLDFTSSADDDDLVAQLGRAVKDSYDNGYRDGAVDTYMEHAERCPGTRPSRVWWRDGHDATFPPYPPFILIVSASALNIADPTTVTNAFLGAVTFWVASAIAVRITLVLYVIWTSRTSNDNERDH